jgi:caa(3)-type oxidase subunit IV
MTREQFRHVVVIPIGAWAALCVALVATAVYATLPHAPARLPVALAISGFKAAIVAIIFMRLDRSSSLVRLTALAGFAWLSLLGVFAFADYLTRAVRP